MNANSNRGLEKYWQLGKSLSSSNEYMFENQLCSDVKFKICVIDQPVMEINAHKYILISRSPVFEAMLCSNMLENSCSGQSAIVISDIEADAFRETLRFMYCDKATLTFHNVCSVLYASKKYILPELTNCCKIYLEGNLEIENVCTIIDQSITYDEHELTEKCLSFINPNAYRIFKHDTFLNLSQAALGQIVSSDYLYVECESWIFKECLRWAEHRRSSVRTNNNTLTDSEYLEDIELRQILGDILFKIRYMNMDAVEFAKEVGKLNILSEKEKSLLYYHILTNEKLPTDSPFKQDDRVFKCSRFTTIGTAKQWWSCNGPTEAINFSTDTDISLIGVAVYGGKSQSQHEIKVEICSLCDKKEDFMNLNSIEDALNSDGSANLWPIYFKKPVPIQVQTIYTLFVTMKGMLTHYGINGKEVVTSAGVTFNFTSSTKSSNGTNVKSGQIPQLIFTKVTNMQE